MAETKVASSSLPPRRGRWLRVTAWIIGVFVLLLVLVYFVGTSPAFLKGVILPKVSKSLNADITVSDASISPFREVILRNLKVQPTGQEALVTAPEVHLRYHLMDIIGGNIHVDEAALTSPTVVVVENPDGTHNYDPLVKKSTEPSKPSGKTPQIDLKKIALTDATVRQIKKYKNGNQDLLELAHLTITAEDVKNGQSGKLAVNADIKMQNNPPSPATNGLIAAKLAGNFTFALDRDLKPASIQGKAQVNIAQATGGMADLAALEADLDCDIISTAIKQVALQFQKNGTRLGEVRVHGPFDMNKVEGRVAVEVSAIDKQVLNIAGAKSGVDFGTTTINSTNEVELAKAGSQFGLKGRLNINKFQVVRAGQGTEPFDLLANYEITPTDIKEVTLRFQQGGATLGDIHASGPFDLSKKEGRIGVQLSGIDKHVLNLAGAKNGLDFGSTVINSTNDIQIAKAASLFKVNGQLKIDRFQVTRNGQSSPPLDLVTTYDETADLDAQTNLLKSFSLLGTQKGNPLIKGELTSPMAFAWGNTASNAVGDSALTLAVNHLELADWKPFIGDTAPAGDVNLKLSLLEQESGKKLTFDLDSKIANLTATAGSNRISQANIDLVAHGEVTGRSRQAKWDPLSFVELTNYKLQLAQQNQQVASVSGSGTYDLTLQNADLQVSAQLLLARLLQLAPQPNMNISSGTAELKTHVVQTGPTNSPTRNVTGTLNLTDFTGKVGNNQFQSFGSAMDLDVSVTPKEAQVRKLAGKINQGPNAGGTFDVTATYDLTNKAAQFTAKISDFNQNGLRPFLEPMLGDKKLVSVGLNANATGQYNPKGDSAVKADVQLANLVVNDPGNQIPATPLEAKMQVDASLQNNVATVRQFQIGLTPTDRGKNELQLKGQVDMSNTNGIQGKLALTADSLDLTKYYDLFGGEKKETAKPAAGAKPTAQPAPAPQPVASAQKPAESKPVRFGKFDAEINIGRCYLREVELTNLQAVANMSGTKVEVKPLQVAVNGAPVKGNVQLNLGIPGYSYDVNLSAVQIPMAPVVNTFVPEKRGQVKGTLTAQAQVSGTGTSGADLQKSLTGQFDIGTTNLDLAIPQLRSKLLKLIVNVIGVVPTLVKNPAGAVPSLVGNLFGTESGSGGWANELQQSPIDVIQAKGSVGSGKVNLEKAVIESPAFQVETAGTVTLAEVMTNSTLDNLPLGISVRRGLLEKINFVPPGTPPNAAYARLPDYVTIAGTVGDPKEKINKTALLGTALQQFGGNIPGVSKPAGNIIQGLGGFLTGRQSGTTNAPNATTNQPPTNQSPVNSLLNRILKPK